jgi:hypothetical protein
MIGAALACVLFAAGARAQEPTPEPAPTDEPARGPQGADEPQRVPDDRAPEPEPEPEPRPEEPDPLPEPEPMPEPPPEVPPEPAPEPEPEPTDTSSRRVTAAPFGELGVAHREAELKLGGDLVIAPKCRRGGPGCSGGRIGFAARFPVTETSTSGGGRNSVNALDGFAGGWRVGLIGDFIRDTTGATGPAKFWMLSLGIEWGVQTWHWFPDAGPDESSATRHSFDVLGRFLHYLHEPRRFRVAPQILVRYARDYAGARPVGVLQPAEGGAPEIAIDRVIDAPGARPAFIATAAALFSIQRGRVMRQLGFGPALSWAAAGDRDGYDPFDAEHTMRLESWIYWYPAGASYLEGAKTNVRIGVAPYVDAFLRRVEGTPQVVPGALLEVKIGVRGYEY